MLLLGCWFGVLMLVVLCFYDLLVRVWLGVGVVGWFVLLCMLPEVIIVMCCCLCCFRVLCGLLFGV